MPRLALGLMEGEFLCRICGILFHMSNIIFLQEA
jgi:hypothetical protein